MLVYEISGVGDCVWGMRAGGGERAGRRLTGKEWSVGDCPVPPKSCLRCYFNVV